MSRLVPILHTKRSPKFQEEIEKLCEALSPMWVGKHDNFASRIIEILRKNTTDSACMVNAKDDEPVFVLKGKDQTADKVVDHWCELQIELGINARIQGDEHGYVTPPKVADARVCAEEMRNYPGRKRAD